MNSLYTYLAYKMFDSTALRDGKKITARLKKLINLLDLPSISISNPKPSLCILSELVCKYYDDLPFDTDERLKKKKNNQSWYLFDDVSFYEDPKKGTNCKKHLLDNYTKDIIFDFFRFFVNNDLWIDEAALFPTVEDHKDTLNYLNKYHRILVFWYYARGYKDRDFDFYPDIKSFALALYDRKKLPMEQEYIEYSEDILDIIEDELKLYDIDNMKRI